MSKALDKLQTVFIKLFEAEKKMKGKDPCWKGYEMIGMKKKNGKDVPNCVPKNEEVEIAEAKVGDTVSFHHEMKAAPGQKVKKSGTVEKVDGDVVHVKVKDKYGVKRHQVKMSDLVKEETELDEAAKLQGTPVVSLSDFTDKDNTKNKYGQIVPKKLKPNDPRVKTYTEPKKEQGVKEEVELDEASDSKRPPNFTMHPIDRQDYKILKDPKKKPLPKDSKEWGRDGSEKKMKEEVELDEVSQDALRNYFKKSVADLSKRQIKMNTGSADSNDAKKMQDRKKGLSRASAKIAAKMEEVELDQLFTEAMKVKKKSEETSSKKSIKKGEPLSGKQEPVKMHPEVQTKN